MLSVCARSSSQPHSGMPPSLARALTGVARLLAGKILTGGDCSSVVCWQLLDFLWAAIFEVSVFNRKHVIPSLYVILIELS